MTKIEDWKGFIMLFLRMFLMSFVTLFKLTKNLEPCIVIIV